ncbi:MAG: PASTA domain-containing protein [Acidobacteriota bacterium]|nr:PASTA domain-containing protein [Acidobacteriota bacterium]
MTTKDVSAVTAGLLVAGVVMVGSGAGNAPAASNKVTIPLRARETELASAFALLRSLGLRVAIDRSASYSSLTPAWVAKLSPRVGTRVSIGTVVTVTPSNLGPRGSPSVLKSHPRYRVPSFIGKTAATAIAWANRHHMYWSIPAIPTLPASSAPTLFAAYRVTSQTPKPGGTIVQGIMIGKGFRPTPLTLTLQR